MKILIVEDDPVLIDLLRFLIQREGFEVYISLDGETGFREFRRQQPDLILMDVILPRRTGIEVLKQIRRESHIPIVLLTALGDEDSVVEGLRMGADLYILKPFRPRELLAHLHAILRRTHQYSSQPTNPIEPLVCGGVILNPMRHEVRVRGELVHLTPIEFKILQILMQNAGQVVSIQDLMQQVWGYGSEVTEAVVKVNILRIRRKIEVNPSKPVLILAVAGEGYMFADPGDMKL